MDLNPATGDFSGYASVYGVSDLVGDVVAPGAFVNLGDFSRRGVIAWNHDTSRPVAMPLLVHDDGVGLFVFGRFHGTADGQDARRILVERKAAGLGWGMSFGYLVLKSEPRRGGRGSLLQALYLLEVSLVAVPANPAAGITDVKDGNAARPRPASLEVLALREEARFLGVPL